MPRASLPPSKQQTNTGDRNNYAIQRARHLNRGDQRIYRLCTLSPSSFFKQSPEGRQAFLRDAAELLCLSSVQEIARSEWLDLKSASPNQNISFGTRWDKVFNTNNDAGAVTISIPKAALQALQIGIAVQVKPQPVGVKSTISTSEQ
jgi:hypothetical protein